MSTVIVANPKAGSGYVFKKQSIIHRKISHFFADTTWFSTNTQGDATHIVRNAIHSGAKRIVVVGGDGTINEAINGFYDHKNNIFIGENVVLVIYPVGTGSDFARSIGLSKVNIENIWQKSTEKLIDLGMLIKENKRRYFINISSFGASGEIVHRVNKSTKIWGGKASFMLKTLSTLASYKNKRIYLRVDDHFEDELCINTVAIANGRYFGGSMKIAPNAYLNDSKLDVIILSNIGLKDFIKHSKDIYQGTHLRLPFTRVLQGKVIEARPINPRSNIRIDIDGENMGDLPVRYEVIPQKIKLYAPWESIETHI